MKSPSRLFTLVFTKIRKTIYVEKIWKINYKERNYGLYVFKDNLTMGLGLIIFEITLYDWSWADYMIEED